jgi:hypothetical protein
MQDCWIEELRSAVDWYDEAILRLGGEGTAAKSNAEESFRCLFAAIQTHDVHGPRFPRLEFDDEKEEAEARRMLGTLMHAVTKMHGKQQVELIRQTSRCQIGLDPLGSGTVAARQPVQWGGGCISFATAAFWPAQKPIPFRELKAKSPRRTLFDGLDQNRRGLFVLQDVDESIAMFMRVEEVYCVDDRPVALVQYVRHGAAEVHAPGSLVQDTIQTLINYNREEHTGMFPIEGMTAAQVHNQPHRIAFLPSFSR